MSAPIGGQAVLEGVMMRGPSNWAVAVRKPNGQIAEVCRPIESVMKRHRLFRLPVVRGVIALGESLAIGFRALAISANYAAAEDNEEAETELSRGALVFAFLLAIGFAISLFKVGPALLADLLPIKSGTWFVLVEGLIRVTVFVAYLFLISLLPDLRRVFQYHAAEHKAINAYEAGEELEPESVQRFSMIHPRCGTAFLLWVMVIAVFVFAFFGRPAWYWLIATRILLLPVIAGLAYELIRFAGKHTENRVVMTLLAPGLWLQRLTTREPSLDQLEVSIRALREVLAQLEARLAELEEELKLALVESDPADRKDVIVEIRQGVGGDEAALWAADLFRMLTRYAEQRGFSVEQLEASGNESGGFKEVVFAVKGDGAYSVFKWEAGTHRVQRVPETESQGRIHTSTATVAVMPEAEGVEVELDPNDLKIDVYRSTGPGGQSVNTTDSAVRITHVPTGIVVAMQDEKSQLQNKTKALRVLRARLYELERERQQAEQAAARRSQIGSGQRAEKIRTDNFPENRLTDHRVHLTVHRLDKNLQGELDEFTGTLGPADRRSALEPSAT